MLNDSQKTALRQLAAARDAVQTLDLDPSTVVHIAGAAKVDLYLHPQTPDELRSIRRQLGQVAKRNDGNGLRLDGQVGDVKVTVFPPLGTCRQVETGEVETVQVPVEFREETRPVVRWECGPVLEDEPVEVPA